MFYFTIQEEWNATDLIDKLIGVGSDEVDKVLELTQEFSLEEDLLDLVDINIGENVELYEITDDIESHTIEYVRHLRKSVSDDDREEFEERIIELDL
jgi:hypothetical protein|uniref:Uncharacterized protein n=1 Tax=Myoviridae sp. ctwmI4 TaxID=2826710 RepID=A0A8S5LU79_9CAUD|nr:MAG TPA: hypothetical protein [Myoviridae sp. ctwmI4]